MSDIRLNAPDPTSKEMVDKLMSLGNLTREENSYLTNLSRVLDKGLGLWMWEKDRLHRIYNERTQ